MRTKIKFKPTEDLIRDSIRLGVENLSNIHGHGKFKRAPFIRSFFLNASEYAQLLALAEMYGVSPQKMIRAIINFRYETLSREVDPNLYELAIAAMEKVPDVKSRPFKPKASLLADAIRLSVQNLSSKKGKGEFSRKPLLKNIYMNVSEATMLRQLADDAGVGMQAYLRSLINWMYEMVSIDADIDLYEYVTSNIKMPNRSDSCYAYATNAIYEAYKETSDSSFAEEIAQTVKSEKFDSELEDAIDAVCFPEDGVDEIAKIQKTLEELLASMKKSQEVIKARGIALELYQASEGLNENLDRLFEDVKEIMKASLLSGEYEGVVLDELDKASSKLNGQLMKVADIVMELDDAWPHLSENEKHEIMNNACIISFKAILLKSLNAANYFSGNLESAYQDVAGFIMRDDEYLVMCSKHMNEARDFLLIIDKLISLLV